jgi:hypothetical protein
VTALRLVWRDMGDVWLADLGRFRAEVWKQGGGFPWSIGVAHRENGIMAPLKREVRVCPETATLEAAQLAAESAALSLLVEALGAFGAQPPGDIVLTMEHDCTTEEFADVAEMAAKYPDDAIALGVALVAAGVAARKAGG